jgi:hypothetical protein
MDFSLSEEQVAIREAVERMCASFDDDYWLGSRHPDAHNRRVRGRHERRLHRAH